jgi:hypothetical protein
VHPKNTGTEFKSATRRKMPPGRFAKLELAIIGSGRFAKLELAIIGSGRLGYIHQRS